MIKLEVESLKIILESQMRSDQENRILINIFEKSLKWLEDTYDKISIKDAIEIVKKFKRKSNDRLAWMYVVIGECKYHQIVYKSGQFVIFSQYDSDSLEISQNVFVVYLTSEDLIVIQKKYELRIKSKLLKFIRQYIFYSYFLEQKYINYFISLLQKQKLGYNNILNWQNNDKICKIGIIYQGTISIQYQQIRNIQIAEITKGILFSNQFLYNSQQNEDKIIENLQNKLSKFRYVSKSPETIIFYFDIKIFKQNPFNQYNSIIPSIKNQYKQYLKVLQSKINFNQTKVYRKKKQIKSEIKKYNKKERNSIQDKIKIQSYNLIPSRTNLFSTFRLQKTSPDAYQSEDKKNPITLRQLSSSLVTLTDRSQRPVVSKTSLIQILQSSHKLKVHNSLLQAINYKPKNTKSFSNLQRISIHHRQKLQKKQKAKNQKKQKSEPKFFVPEQFVRKTLRMKYESVIEKIKNTDLNIKSQRAQNVKDRLKRLEQQVDSKRIVKINNNKKKYLFLRDKFQN